MNNEQIKLYTFTAAHTSKSIEIFVQSAGVEVDSVVQVVVIVTRMVSNVLKLHKMGMELLLKAEVYLLSLFIEGFLC